MKETFKIRENEKHDNKEFIKNLENILDENIPKLKDGTNILLGGSFNHYQTPENVLWGHVCGRAVRVLGYLLRQSGYDAKRYDTHLLGDKYPSSDHAILMITSPDNKKIIVDPTYLQFINIFYLDKKYMPQKEILMFSVDDVNEIVESFVKLRDIKIAQYPNPTALQMHSPIYKMTREELTEYFLKIWEMKQYSPIQKTLENDISKYESDPGSVTSSTRKLIKYLN